MGYFDLDIRTQLLMRAYCAGGMQILPNDEEGWQVMREMTAEGLFNYSREQFSLGYWWTPAGEQAATEAWEQVPVQDPIETCYRDHPQVLFTVNGYKEESCYVNGPNYAGSGQGLWVRGIDPDRWLVDNPSGGNNMTFGSADDAIAWALGQVGEA